MAFFLPFFFFLVQNILSFHVVFFCVLFVEVFFPQIKFVTTMEIPFRSGLGRTDSKREPRRRPPARHRLPQPFWDRPARAGAGRGAGVTTEGHQRPWGRLGGERQRGIEGKRLKQADAPGCTGKAGAESRWVSGGTKAQVWEPWARMS